MLKRKACPLKDLISVPVLNSHLDTVPLSEQVGLGMRKILGKVTPVVPRSHFYFIPLRCQLKGNTSYLQVAHLGQTGTKSTFIYALRLLLFRKCRSFPHFLKECSPHPSQFSWCITKPVQLSGKPGSISEPCWVWSEMVSREVTAGFLLCLFLDFPKRPSLSILLLKYLGWRQVILMLWSGRKPNWACHGEVAFSVFLLCWDRTRQNYNVHSLPIPRR